MTSVAVTVSVNSTVGTEVADDSAGGAGEVIVGATASVTVTVVTGVSERGVQLGRSREVGVATGKGSVGTRVTTQVGIGRVGIGSPSEASSGGRRDSTRCHRDGQRGITTVITRSSTARSKIIGRTRRNVASPSVTLFTDPANCRGRSPWSRAALCSRS